MIADRPVDENAADLKPQSAALLTDFEEAVEIECAMWRRRAAASRASQATDAQNPLLPRARRQELGWLAVLLASARSALGMRQPDRSGPGAPL